MAEREVLTVREAPDDKLRKHAENRFRAMAETRKDVDADVYDIAGLCMPSRSKQIVENYKAIPTSRGGQRKNASSRNTLYDGHAIRSFEICANGMLSGLSSRSQAWFRPTLIDEDLMAYHPVRLWLDDVATRMYAAFAMSNFYEAALAVYLEMSAFGTAADTMVANDQSISVNHPLTFGEYGLSTGEDGRPSALSRTFTLTTQQMVEKFVADRFDSQSLDWSRVTQGVKEAWNGGFYGRAFVVNQLIEENPAYVPGKLGAIGMRWRSIKWQPDETTKKKFLCIEGFREQPFMAPRWETLSGEDWGTGRGKKALPDMRALQLAAKRSGEAEDMAVKPPTFGPPSIDRVSMLPGSHTAVAAVDMSVGIKPVYEIDPKILSLLDNKIERLHRAVDAMTYADLFMAITNMDGVQPRNVEELLRRHEEQMTQLGPVIDRANSEFLQVAFDRMFGIMARAGMLPPAPPEIQGMEIKVDFVSVLAQAQKLLGISQTERSVAFVGNLAAAFPEAPDNIDIDAIIHDYWDRTGAPAAGLRDTKVRDAIRQGRAQQQQAERMAAMMPATKDGADAARLLSEADTGDGSMLQRLVG
ncbi:portal protein [Sphingomonas sp. URHD0057]|uniref:portal protein n=1 Tax=Sphingomonas sp. URHD0057 TaxID=1380389 RepID=UPI000685FC44|nr:portal protein [Sphingomonas sp. URHD0057]